MVATAQLAECREHVFEALSGEVGRVHHHDDRRGVAEQLHGQTLEVAVDSGHQLNVIAGDLGL